MYIYRAYIKTRHFPMEEAKNCRMQPATILTYPFRHVHTPGHTSTPDLSEASSIKSEYVLWRRDIYTYIWYYDMLLI